MNHPPAVVYLHGFASGPGSTKARFFERKFNGCGVEFVIPDLAAGDFEHLTITGQLRVIEQTAGGRRIVLAGSSLGGYLAALYASRHPEVERLILLAPAFRFAKRLEETLGPGEMEVWRETCWRNVFHYADGRARKLGYGLMEDALAYEDFPQVSQPTLIIHGTQDDVVPSAYSVEFARRHPGAELSLVSSGHELTDVTDQMWERISGFLRLEWMSGSQV